LIFTIIFTEQGVEECFLQFQEECLSGRRVMRVMHSVRATAKQFVLPQKLRVCPEPNMPRLCALRSFLLASASRVRLAYWQVEILARSVVNRAKEMKPASMKMFGAPMAVAELRRARASFRSVVEKAELAKVFCQRIWQCR
jgi:hypothetical protein